MGNSHKNLNSIEDFYMHIQLIGKEMNKFLALISGKAEPSKAKSDASQRKKIEDFWDFDYSKNKDINNQIDDYFSVLLKLKKENKPKQIKEVLVVKIDNPFDIYIEYIFQKLNELREDYCMPIVLFLVVDGKKEISYDKKKYPKVRNNLILSKKYTEEPLYYQDDGYMKNLFIRFCSIHNELGDHFSIGEGKDVIDYDLIRNYYPFNINICVIGRFGQGKSTGVNVLLNEYKAKESSQGGAQTKNLTFYQATNAPIRILDIPGFDSERNVNLAIEKIKMCKEEANKLKDYIHFFLYFLSEEDNRTFSQYESPIIEEIVQYTDSKVIYVVTHSDKDNEEEDNEEFINKINQGINSLSEVSNKEMMKATKDNVVFVNFYNQKKKEAFGKKELFKKIHDYFINSQFFKEASNKLDPEQVEKDILIKKNRANSLLRWNKVGGSLIGLIPGIDWVIQHYVIKKSILRKIGGVFGININFIKEEELKKQNLKEKEKEKLKMNVPGLDDNEKIYAGVDLNLEVDGDNLMTDSTGYKIGNSIKVSADGASYIGGGISVGVGIYRTVTGVAEVATEGTIVASTTTLKILGTAAFALGAFIGVGTGAYFTCKQCKDMIEYFAKFYRDNSKNICKQYFLAIEYLRNNFK